MVGTLPTIDIIERLDHIEGDLIVTVSNRTLRPGDKAIVRGRMGRTAVAKVVYAERGEVKLLIRRWSPDDVDMQAQGAAQNS